MTDWRFRRHSRQILMAFATGDMHLHDAMARLQQLHETADTGQHYNHEKSIK